MAERSYISFGVEGVPNSEVRLILDEGGLECAEVVEAAVAIARLLADEYRREFRLEQAAGEPARAR